MNIQEFVPDIANFQTLPVVANYMASLIVPGSVCLEPTPGAGNLVKAIKDAGNYCIAPKGEYWQFIEKSGNKIHFDYVVMNPPFSPMVKGWTFLLDAMSRCDMVIALLPWFIIINSERRYLEIKKYGLVSITHLPRKAFPNSRIQCCVLQMKRGYTGPTVVEYFTW